MEQYKEHELTCELPDELVEALRSELPPPPDITPGADRAVLNAATQHFTSRELPQRRHWAYSAVAAMVLVAALFAIQYRAPEPATLLYTDVDNSGRIDIADVLALAQRDVDQADLDDFAARVVSISRDEGRT